VTLAIINDRHVRIIIMRPETIQMEDCKTEIGRQMRGAFRENEQQVTERRKPRQQ
jgi:hypothetical protein